MRERGFVHKGQYGGRCLLVTDELSQYEVGSTSPLHFFKKEQTTSQSEQVRKLASRKERNSRFKVRDFNLGCFFILQM